MMIKNIEKMTADEFLRQQIKKGMIPTELIHQGERVDFSPNSITLEMLSRKGADKDGKGSSK